MPEPIPDWTWPETGFHGFIEFGGRGVTGLTISMLDKVARGQLARCATKFWWTVEEARNDGRCVAKWQLRVVETNCREALKVEEQVNREGGEEEWRTLER